MGMWAAYLKLNFGASNDLLHMPQNLLYQTCSDMWNGLPNHMLFPMKQWRCLRLTIKCSLTSCNDREGSSN